MQGKKLLNQLSQLKSTSTKIMPIEKTLANEPAFHQQAFVAYLTIPSGS